MSEVPGLKRRPLPLALPHPAEPEKTDHEIAWHLFRKKSKANQNYNECLL